MKHLRWIVPLLFLLLGAVPAHAQYNSLQGWCEDGNKNATVSGIESTNTLQASYPSCTVTVVIHGGGTATLFSDSSGTPLANPFTANTNGQWQFYAADANYDVTTSGGTPIPLPAPVTYSDLVIGTSGSGPTNAALKPAAADGITFVAPEGSDANDCLSWGSACLTLLGAYNKLSINGGTIYVTSGRQNTGPQCTPTTGQGLGIAGNADPNYASMPEAIGSLYWVKAKTGFSGVSIVGVSATNSGQNSATGALTPIQCGGDSSPAFQFSYTQGITLQNLSMFYPKQGILLGIDSNGSALGDLGASSNFNFENLSISICNSCGATPGPTIWIGGNIIWAQFTNLALQANPNNATAEGRAAILVQVNGGLASGLLHMQHINSVGGGNFVWENDQGTGTGGFDIDDWTMEGSSTSTPIVNVVGSNGIFGGDVSRLGFSDAAPAPWVHVPENVRPYYLHVHPPLGQDGVTIDGPADIIGTMRVGDISSVSKVGQAAVPNVAPQALSEIGYPLGRLSSVQTDVNRRAFLSLARFTNLASQLPAAWTPTTGNVTITTGQTAPDATTNAGKVETTTNDGAIAYAASVTYAIGDYVYIGVWAKPATTAGPPLGSITSSTLCLCFPFGSGPSIKLMSGSYNANAGSVLGASSSPQTDGEWQYLWAMGKVIDGAGSAGTRLLLNAVSPTTPMIFYAPVFTKISASTLALVAAPTFATGTETDNIVTIGTSAAHGLTSGEPISISSCTPSGYNGERVIRTTPLTTSFTYYNATSGLGAASGCIITPGNDSEAADWALNTGSWADGVPANTIVSPRGVKFTFGGSGNFYGTLTQGNTGNRSYTFPDADATMAGLDTAQTFSNKTLLDTTTTFANTSAPTKTMKLDLSGVTAGAQATLAFTHSTGRTYTFPNLTGTICLTTGACNPLYNHSGTQATIAHMIQDSCVLGTDCAVTLTGSAVFTSSTSYTCVAQDQTAAAATKIAQASGSAFTITGTGTDTIRYTCIGN